MAMECLSDQGSQFENSIYFFQSIWRPLDFGWPFYEGSQSTGTSAPSQINGPTLAYGVGQGFGEGEGPTEGFEYSGTALQGIDGHYVFGDKGGKIFSIPTTTLFDGFLHSGTELEDRSADFAPDVGTIDSVVAFTRTDTAIYILDPDGEVFRVEQG